MVEGLFLWYNDSVNKAKSDKNAEDLMKQSDFNKAPVCAKKEQILENFAVKRTDNYFWLNQKENTEVIDYIKKENAYTNSIMDSTKELQDSIFDEIKGRLKEDDESYPHLDNGYYYYVRTIKGKQYLEYLRKKGSLDAKEEMIFDVNKMAEGHNAFIFGGYEISPNNKLAMYLYNTTGSYAEFDMKIRDLESGKDLDLCINGVASFAFCKDSETIFYSKINEQLRSTKIYRQKITDSEAVLVYEEEDEKFSTYVANDKLNKYIYISCASATTSEERFVSSEHPEEDFKLFMPRKHRVEYGIAPHTDSFFVRYKDDDNLNGKVYRVPFDSYQDASSWQEIVPHNEKVTIEGMLILEQYLIFTIRENGLRQIKIMSLKDGDNYKIEEIKFPEVVYSVGLGSNAIFESKKIRYSYNSMKRPATLYEFDIESKESKVLKVQEIPSGFNSDDYEVERIMVEATDGAKVPLALVYKKGIVKDGSNPCLLYAYGSYGVNTGTGFNSSVYSLIDRGYIYAIAQIRGGSEMGEAWYEDGKMLNKMNTFTDFITCSEYLINEKYTSNTKLAIRGGSAGGLLMGAVVNMRPDLYQSVLSLVPFVDVVTTMLDTSLPLTTGEYEEWGNPNDKEYFDYMLSYSPYDNIEAKDYPNMLVTGGLNDSQVMYHEPTKYVAKLRELKTDDNILLLRMNMDSGHGGATGRYERIKDIAFEYAFVLKTIQ